MQNTEPLLNIVDSKLDSNGHHVFIQNAGDMQILDLPVPHQKQTVAP
jgi:hypothetical protein